MRTHARATFLVAACLTLSLASCKKAPTPDRTYVPSGKPLGAPGAARLNAFVDSYNTLLDTFGLAEEYGVYRDNHITTATPASTIVVNPVNTIDRSLADFKKAQALPGTTNPALESAAGQLIPAIEKVTTRQDALAIYYSSGSYREDHLARGKQEDPLLLSDYRNALAASDQFKTALDAALQVRDQALLARLKASGNLLAYDSRLALQQSDALTRMFHGPADVKNPNILRRADDQAHLIEQTLTDQRAEVAKFNQTHKDSLDAVTAESYNFIGSDLTALVGHYRTFKESGSKGDYMQMITDYNNAINQENGLRGRE